MGVDVESALVELMTKFINTVAVKLPSDVYAKLLELSSKETSSSGKFIYSAIFKNLELALLRKAPLCQDTGVLEFYVTLGEMFPYKSLLLKSIRKAVIESTKQGFLRPNVVDPVSDKNTGDNTGPLIPWIEVDIEPGSDHVDVRLYMAGGGSSRPGTARVLDPAEGWEGLVKFVIDVIAKYGPPACPPLMVVGVGVGPTVEIAAVLSKRALLRPLGSRNPEPSIARLEEILEDAINKLGIGPQGLGGSTTVGEVHIEYAGRHPATFAVGVNTACWALRKGWLRINSDLSYQLLSHRGGLIE
ncbi:MAG: fumarate hydratase [Desulfurococcaceae archaeon]